MRKTTLLIVVFFLLSSCGGQIAWKHPNNYEAVRVQADSKECHYKAKNSPCPSPGSDPASMFGCAVSGAVFYRSDYKDCMKLKGYYEAEDELPSKTQSDTNVKE